MKPNGGTWRFDRFAHHVLEVFEATSSPPCRGGVPPSWNAFGLGQLYQDLSSDVKLQSTFLDIRGHVASHHPNKNQWHPRPHGGAQSTFISNAVVRRKMLKDLSHHLSRSHVFGFRLIGVLMGEGGV